MTLNPSAAQGSKRARRHRLASTAKTSSASAVPAGSEIGTGQPQRADAARWLADRQRCTSVARKRVRSPDRRTRSTWSRTPTRYGVSVRFKGEVIPNEATGQLTTVFTENPEQPFTNLTLHFNRGALTPVANPLLCGTPTGPRASLPVAQGAPNADGRLRRPGHRLWRLDPVRAQPRARKTKTRRPAGTPPTRST